MPDHPRLSRPFRTVDLSLLGVGVIVTVIGAVIGHPTTVHAGILGILLGSSTGVVAGGLEQFTGEALGDAGDIDEDTGWLIGKLENVIVFVLVLLGEWTALSIVFAAKSIVRREDISSGKTTYYLAGTLLNFTYSIAVGIVARWSGTVGLELLVTGL